MFCPKKIPPDRGKVQIIHEVKRCIRAKGGRKVALVSAKPINGVDEQFVRNLERKRNICSIRKYYEKHGIQGNECNGFRGRMARITWNKDSLLNKNGDIALKAKKYKYEPPQGSEVIEVEHQNDGWFIQVPLRYGNKIETVELFADVGADTAGINEEFARQNYPDLIQKQHKGLMVDTPNGTTSVHEFVTLTFERSDGCQWVRKFYLFPGLPVNILADINLLKAFGYKFVNGVPPCFEELRVDEVELELELPQPFTPRMNLVCSKNGKENGTLDESHKNENIHRMFLACKRSGIEYINKSTKLLDRVYAGGKCINDNTIKNESSILTNYARLEKIKEFEKELDDINCDRGRWNSGGNQINLSHYLELTSEELEKAKELVQDRELKWADWSYLKGPEYQRLPGLYDEIIKLREEFKDVFAKTQFHRRDIKYEPVSLGLKPEVHDNDMVVNEPQYPLNREKLLAMAAITLKRDKNGMNEKPDPLNLNNVPYSLFNKNKGKVGKKLFYKDFFDLRRLNELVKLIIFHMPTTVDVKDFMTDWYEFLTVWDVKSYYNGFVLRVPDRKYTKHDSPVGPRQHRVLAYGHANAPAISQKFSNLIAKLIMMVLIWIDDGIKKHKNIKTTADAVAQVRRILEIARDFNMLLHPEKFFPLVTGVEFIGMHYKTTRYMVKLGKRLKNIDINQWGMTEEYRKKMLAFKKPITCKDMAEFQGSSIYIGAMIYQLNHFMFFLQEIKNEAIRKGRSKLFWTPQADYAFAEIIRRIANAKLLYCPKRQGRYLVKTDSSGVAGGGVLFQEQEDEQGHFRWCMIELYSKAYPKQYWPYHICVKELYIGTAAFHKWDQYLMPAVFLWNTDHKNLVVIIKDNDLDPVVARLVMTLMRWRFDVSDVLGDYLPICDQISREKIDVVFALEPFVFEGKKFKNWKDYQEHLEVDVKEKKLKASEYKKKIELRKDETVGSVNNIIFYKYNELNEALIESKSNSMYLNSVYKIINNTSDKCGVDDRHRLNIINQSINNKFKFNNLKWKVMINNRNTPPSMEYEMEQVAPEIDGYERIKALFDFGTSFACLALKMSSSLRSAVCKCLTLTCDDVKELSKRGKAGSNRFENESESAIIAKFEENKLLPIRTRAQRQQEERKEQEQHRLDYYENEIEWEQDEFIEAEKEQNINKFKFLQHIYRTIWGGRDKIDWMDMKVFLECQKKDKICEIVRKYIIDENFHNDSPDMLELKEYHPVIFKAAVKGKLVIIEGVICYDRNTVYLNMAPDELRNRIIDYAHWSPMHGHTGIDQTIKWIKNRFWWPALDAHITEYVSTCDTCQRARGAIRRKHGKLIPLLSDAPREWIFVDFAGPYAFGLYICVICDHFSGYVLLVPTYGCDAEAALQAIIQEWTTLFGWFKFISSDRGPAFLSELLKRCIVLLGSEQHLAEARNHRSIGKVERAIKILQEALQKWNIALDNLISEALDRMEAIEAVLIAIKPIQAGINARISRVHQLSANMLFFGAGLLELCDIKLSIKKLDKLKEERKWKETELQYLHRLQNDLKMFNDIAIKNRNQYVKIMIKDYNWANHKIDIIYKSGDSVLYFIGDQVHKMQKLRERWSGPWIVQEMLNTNTVALTDNDNLYVWPAHVERVKLYKKGEAFGLAEFDRKEKSGELKQLRNMADKVIKQGNENNEN